MAGDVLDEATVDLDLVEREALQIAQRGVAGPEIVHRDTNAKSTQLIEHGKRCVVIADQDRLGDFQFQPMGREAGIRECR